MVHANDGQGDSTKDQDSMGADAAGIQSRNTNSEKMWLAQILFIYLTPPSSQPHSRVISWSGNPHPIQVGHCPSPNWVRKSTFACCLDATFGP